MTRTLSDFVANTQFDDVPATLVDRLKVYAIDALAAGFVAGDLPWVTSVRSVTERLGGVGEASAFGTVDRLPAPHAALVNGVAIGGMELDHGGFLAHPASTIFPAVLASAEALHASGSDFLSAMAVGYEVACRVGAAQTRATEDARGFHNPGINGPFGSAAAVGKLLGLDGTTMAFALGIAGSHSGGTVEYLADGSMTKRLHLGLAAEGGLRAARLAQEGFTGPSTILEGDHGVLRAFSPAPDIAALGRDLGTDWLAARLRTKRYPCHGAVQAVVAAMQELRRQHPLTAASVHRIHVAAGADDRLLQSRFLHPRPRSLVEAQCSTPFTLAVAALRDLTNPHEFDQRVLEDAGIAELANRVTWQRTDDPTTTVTVACAEATYQVAATDLIARGPDTLSGAVDRFRRYAASTVPHDSRESMVAMLLSLESISDVTELASMIAQRADGGPTTG